MRNYLFRTSNQIGKLLLRHQDVTGGGKKTKKKQLPFSRNKNANNLENKQLITLMLWTRYK